MVDRARQDQVHGVISKEVIATFAISGEALERQRFADNNEIQAASKTGSTASIGVSSVTVSIISWDHWEICFNLKGIYV